MTTEAKRALYRCMASIESQKRMMARCIQIPQRKPVFCTEPERRSTARWLDTAGKLAAAIESQRRDLARLREIVKAEEIDGVGCAT